MRYHTGRILSFLAYNDWAIDFVRDNENEESLSMIKRTLDLTEDDFEEEIIVEKMELYRKEK